MNKQELKKLTKEELVNKCWIQQMVLRDIKNDIFDAGFTFNRRYSCDSDHYGTITIGEISGSAIYELIVLELKKEHDKIFI